MSAVAPNFRELYKFEKYLEAAFEKWLNENAELNLVGTAKVDDVENSEGAAESFQKKRPRVECFCTPGAPLGHFILDADTRRRENGWHATIVLGCITRADDAIHHEYRAAVRDILATADEVLGDDNIYLPYHAVSQCFGGGSSAKITPQEGIFVTQLTYNIIFAVQPSAWPGGLTN